MRNPYHSFSHFWGHLTKRAIDLLPQQSIHSPCPKRVPFVVKRLQYPSLLYFTLLYGKITWATREVGTELAKQIQDARNFWMLPILISF